ncbi:hypothetical protein [Streptococcus sobrinus]|uniref:Class IIb bacteriocin, lactobin A/cerein 7B family n=1 Tax=Streptococcus sobrinus TaxID=1310 RepID=A0ABN5LL62_9STRE|nr:hypothetical protein [Streptococcus sobrinus]AWN21571.1 hypothetical protein DK182_09655 [Streptococcus sobrinus]EMP70590.1 hypothetical protein D823_09237 [Streptococcus sobrinus DSM 20742 = ATCC 33478]SQG14403.1 Uncharacterised protein [Streptococcus sobrinus]
MDTLALDNFEAANMSELSEVQGGFSWQDAIPVAIATLYPPLGAALGVYALWGTIKPQGILS